MLIIPSDAVEDGSRPGLYTIEASTARLAVGHWPDSVSFRNDVLFKTHVEQDEQDEDSDFDPDIQWVQYTSANKNVSLIIFND